MEEGRWGGGGRGAWGGKVTYFLGNFLLLVSSCWKNLRWRGWYFLVLSFGFMSSLWRNMTSAFTFTLQQCRSFSFTSSLSSSLHHVFLSHFMCLTAPVSVQSTVLYPNLSPQYHQGSLFHQQFLLHFIQTPIYIVLPLLPVSWLLCSQPSLCYAQHLSLSRQVPPSVVCDTCLP